jgi:major membrane immunogen (membrane-anchored lipoprotein)
MKKMLGMFFVVLLGVVLMSCQEKEYAIDGEYLAYELSVSRNAPQVVFVTVTILNGEIASYHIDTRQGERTGDGSEATPYAFSWNPLTKVELGNDYGMKANSDIDKEWFEQAAALEAFWLENGLDAVETDQDGYVDNVTGASFRDSYTAVAKKALEHAKAHKFVSIYTSGTDLYFAEMVVKTNGDIESLVLDVRQKVRSNDGSFEWNSNTKQQLGDDYGMKGAGAGFTFENGVWVPSGTQASLEWYEQANLITEYIIDNGWTNNLQPIDNRGGSLNGTTLIDELSGATIRTGGYYAVLRQLFEFAGSSVK